MTRTEKFIQDNKRTLTCGRDYFNPDTSFMPVEKFEKSKLKVLVCFPSPSSVKAVSTTKEALNDYVIEHCPDVFIDFCFIPDASDIKLFDKHAIPYAVGMITHLDASHFDVIGMSISVLSEVITMASVINSFQRCDKPIPLTWTERKDMRLGEVPIIFAGGITAACGDIMYGELGDGRQAFADFTYLGECGKLGVVFNRLIEARETGKVTRSKEDRFTYGYADDPDEDKYESLIEDVVTNQDYIDTLFDLRCIYQPQAYEVKFNDKTQIISNIKINPKAQDWVKPYYPHKMNDDLGIGRAIINASGENTGTTQTQVSEGAHMKGNWIRTLKGLVRIEDLCSKEVGDSECSGIVDTIDGPGKLYHRFTQGVKPVLIFTLKSGIRIGLTAEHPVEQWHIGDESSEFVRADSLSVGDFFMTKKSHVFGSYPMTPDEAEFLGRMVGDGSYNLYKDSREGHGTPVHRMYLSCAWSEKEYCEDLLNRAGINYKLDGNQGRHCRFWIKEVDKKGRSMREFWGFNEFYKEREGKPSVKYIPATAYKLTEEAMKSFLKGYHDADGCTSTKQGLSKVTFDCCHESIIDDIQQFLLMVGIPSRKHFNEKSRVVDEEYGFYDTVNEHWSLVIASEYFDKFNELGVLKRAFGRSTRSKEHLPMPANIRELLYKTSLSTTERSHAFAQVRRNSFTKYLADKCGFKYPDVVFDEIVKIEVSESETYDLSVDKLEKLTANGCSVHNCSAGGACSFCAEGNYTGGWCEKPKEQILHEIREAKKYSAGYKYKPFSFNCNYLTDYKGMLYEFIQRYPKVTFINMRMEELGRDVDAIKMMKLIGSNRISAPMEGISPRIQNVLLNKCLSEESLNAFMDDMVHAKMGDIKVGGIFTAFEEDEDFQWICDFVDKFKKRAKQEGGNFPFRLKVTPLVHYNLTPCEYLPRLSAKKSMMGEHWLTDEWYEKFREHNVFFKVNGFRYSTFLEQSIIDLGRKATHIVYEQILKKGVEVYSLRSIAKPEIIQAFKDEINPDYFFNVRDPEHYISLSHRIHIDLMGSYIPRARRLVRNYINGNVFEGHEDVRCLKTFDGAKTMCYSKCAVKDPLKIYNDVTMDEEGNLHGEYRLLIGCERCQSTELKLARLKRPTPFTKNSDDILAAPRMKKVQRLRFVINRNKEYDVLNPNNTAHTFIAKFLQKSEKLTDCYHSMNIHSMAWQAEPDLPYVCEGIQIVDTIWTSAGAYDEVSRLISEVNSDMKSVQILSCREVLMNDKLDCDDYNVFRFETKLPYDLFATSLPSYKGEIKIQGDFEAVIKKDKNCRPPVFIQAGKVVGYFALPMKYNPVFYMQQFLNAKKLPGSKIMQEIDFKCVMAVSENSRVICKNCNSEIATISLSSGKNFPFGVNCLLKALLSKEMKS